MQIGDLVEYTGCIVDPFDPAKQIFQGMLMVENLFDWRSGAKTATVRSLETGDKFNLSTTRLKVIE